MGCLEVAWHTQVHKKVVWGRWAPREDTSLCWHRSKDEQVESSLGLRETQHRCSVHTATTEVGDFQVGSLATDKAREDTEVLGEGTLDNLQLAVGNTQGHEEASVEHTFVGKLVDHSC